MVHKYGLFIVLLSILFAGCLSDERMDPLIEKIAADEQQRIFELIDQAKIDNNPQACFSLQGTWQDLCVEWVAIDNNNVATCELAGSLEEACYRDISWQTGNLGLCDRIISNQGIKEQCLEGS